MAESDQPLEGDLNELLDLDLPRAADSLFAIKTLTSDGHRSGKEVAEALIATGFFAFGAREQIARRYRAGSRIALYQPGLGVFAWIELAGPVREGAVSSAKLSKPGLFPLIAPIRRWGTVEPVVPLNKAVRERLLALRGRLAWAWLVQNPCRIPREDFLTLTRQEAAQEALDAETKIPAEYLTAIEHLGELASSHGDLVLSDDTACPHGWTIGELRGELLPFREILPEKHRQRLRDLLWSWTSHNGLIDVAAASDNSAKKTRPQIARQEYEVVRWRLSATGRRVIELRHGIWGGRGATLQEIGERMSLTRERVRQIEVRALEDVTRFLDRREAVDDSKWKRSDKARPIGLTNFEKLKRAAKVISRGSVEWQTALSDNPRSNEPSLPTALNIICDEADRELSALFAAGRILSPDGLSRWRRLSVKVCAVAEEIAEQQALDEETRLLINLLVSEKSAPDSVAMTLRGEPTRDSLLSTSDFKPTRYRETGERLEVGPELFEHFLEWYAVEHYKYGPPIRSRALIAVFANIYWSDTEGRNERQRLTEEVLLFFARPFDEIVIGKNLWTADALAREIIWREVGDSCIPLFPFSAMDDFVEFYLAGGLPDWRRRARRKATAAKRRNIAQSETSRRGSQVSG